MSLTETKTFLNRTMAYHQIRLCGII